LVFSVKASVWKSVVPLRFVLPLLLVVSLTHTSIPKFVHLAGLPTAGIANTDDNRAANTTPERIRFIRNPPFLSQPSQATLTYTSVLATRLVIRNISTCPAPYSPKCVAVEFSEVRYLKQRPSNTKNPAFWGCTDLGVEDMVH
jgi:hypothetical protein